MGKLFSDYRPELHYMRGPGPAWQEKHSGLPAPEPKDDLGLPNATWLVPAATIALVGLAAIVALA